MKEIALILIFIDFTLITFSYLNVFYDMGMVQWITNMGDWVQRLHPMMQQLMAGDYSIFTTYPLVFFLFMIPFYWMDYLYLSIISAALIFGMILLFTYKMEGFYASLLTGIMLMSSFIFLIYSISIVPNLLELEFFLAASYFFLKDKKMTASAFMLLMMYSHATNILFFFIFMIYSLIYKRSFLKYLGIIFIMSIPILYLFTSNAILGGIDMLANITIYSGDYVINILLGNPLAFILSSGLVIWLLLPVSLFIRCKHRSWRKEQLFYVIWMLVFLPFFILAVVTKYDIIRWIFLFIIPISVFEASTVGNKYDFLN